MNQEKMNEQVIDVEATEQHVEKPSAFETIFNIVFGILGLAVKGCWMAFKAFIAFIVLLIHSVC